LLAPAPPALIQVPPTPPREMRAEAPPPRKRRGEKTHRARSGCVKPLAPDDRRRLKEAQNAAAMLTTFNEVDMSAVMELRNRYKDLFEKKHA